MIATAFEHHLQQGHTLGNVLVERAGNSQEAISFIDREQRLHALPYRQLLADAGRLAGRLQEHGLQVGQPVLIVMDDEATLVRTFWAVVLAGGMASPLTPPGSYSSRDPALQKICQVIQRFVALDDACPWLITDLDAGRMTEQDAVARCRDAGRLIDITSWQDSDDTPGFAPPPTPAGQADDVALLMFSSGSTGDPKGVQLTHRQLLCNLAQIAERSALVASDRSLSWLPLTHDMGLVLFHLCHTLAGIAQFKMTPLAFARAPASLPTLATRLRATLLGMPNFGFDQLQRLPDPEEGLWQLDSVRLIYNGAEPIDPVLTRQFLTRFARFGLDRHVVSPGWGIAEACVVASAFSCRQLASFDTLPTCWVRGGSALQAGAPLQFCEPDEPGALELVALGEPVRGLEIRVLDDDGQALPPGHLGHLQIRGPNVTRGYHGQPPQSWCPTGDLGFMARGLVYLQGRAKDVLFINGRNFFSNDLETALCHATDWPANQLAVVGCTDPARRTERVVIFFRHARSDGDSLPVASRLREALERILGYPVAAAIPLSALPKTTSGKVRRFALRQALQEGQHDAALAMAQATHAGGGHTRPVSGREQALLTCLRPLLSPEHANDDVDPAVPLSRYGLDSVGYMQLAAAVGAQDGREHDAAAWMQAGSLEGIIRCIDEDSSEARQETLAREVPLSPRQQALWLGLQVEPETPAGLPGRYIEAYWLDLAGTIDVPAWMAAARTVLDSHPVLSSRLVDGSDGPILQHLGKPLHELQHVRCPASEFERYSQALACRPLDLQQGPVLRLHLLESSTRASDGQPRWRICIQTHHLLADGWSLYLLLNQCMQASAATTTLSRTDGLWPEPAGADPASIGQWCRKLADAGMMLPHASHDHASPGPVQILRTWLSPRSLQALKTWTGAGRQVFSLVGSALMALLSRMTGVGHGIIGTVASGRLLPATHQRFAYLARSHAIHAHIDAHTSLRTLLASLDEQREAIVAQRTPELCELATHPDGEDIPGRIGVVYVHQNMPALRWPSGLRRLDDGTYRGLARVPLYLSSEWVDDGLRLHWEFDGDRLTLPQVEDLAELLDHVLAEALQDPDAPLAMLSLLSPRQALAWSAYQGEPRLLRDDDVVIGRIAQAAARWPLLTAVSDERETLSYTALWQRVGALCTVLQARHGLQRGDRVALLTSRETGYVVGLLALFRLGVVAVPLDPALPPERMALILRQSGASLLLGTPATRQTAEGHALPHAVIDGERLAAQEERPVEPVRGNDPAYLIFTSGSTGAPKGVTICHRSITNLVDWVVRAFRYRAGETICQFAPFSFDVSMAEILPSLCAGMHVHVLPDARRASPQLYLQTMKEQAAQVATLTPAYVAVLNEIPDSCRDSLSSLRLLIMGGEALPLDTVRRWHAHSPQVELVNVYGPTETTVMSSACWIGEGGGEGRRIMPLGRPISNTEFWVLDANRQPCPRGVEGMLYIGGSGLAQGYWQDEARTDEAFLYLCPDASQGPRRFYNSGDMARLAHDGALEFAGRADSQVKLRGFRIELGDIEHAALRCPGVQEAVACVVERTGDERVLVLYWRGEQQDAAAIMTHLKDRLPVYMQPAACCRVEQWPLTANRKIDKRRLPPPRWHGTPPVAAMPAAPVTAPAPPASAPDTVSPPASASSTVAASGRDAPVAEVPAHPAAVDTGGSDARTPAAPSPATHESHTVNASAAATSGTDAGHAGSPAMQQRLAAIWQEILGVEQVSADDEFALLGGSSLSTARLVNRIRQQLQRDVSLADILAHSRLADMASLLETAPRLDSTTNDTPSSGAGHGQRYPFAASPAQARMIYLEHEHAGTALNTIPLTLALDVALPPERLRAAIRTLHERHDLLRARFDLQARQLTLLDGAPCPTLEHRRAGGEEEALQLLSTFHARPYDVAQGPLWRVIMVDTQVDGADRHWLAVSMHHAISDGVTMSRLLRELDSLLQGQALPAIDTEAHYADYVDWQAHWLASADSAAARRYWSGGRRIPALAPLPRHGQSSPGQEVAGRQFVFELDERRSTILASLARELRVTPFVMMCTLFSLVIARQCHVRTMAIGITLSGRSRAEFEQVMGLMVNTLPMAFDWKPQESFRALLGRMARRVTRLIAFQDYPLDRILADQKHAGAPFNIIFNEEVLPSSLHLGGAEARLAKVSSGVAKLPMVISCLVVDGRWCARMEIRNDVCPPDWVSTLLTEVEHLARHLDGMADARLDELQAPDDHLLSLLDNLN
ncbi:MAG: amino acid adenylation domain-containing protein [Lautropia sp.]|nr:amino acid adenylation domain-containing protein [Lautropia sp.]